MRRPAIDTVQQPWDFSGRAAVITGAASGIGRATAIMLAQAGADVVIGDTNEEGLEETARAIDSANGRGISVKTDVTDSAQVSKLVQTAVDEFGKLDFMGNIAGILVTGLVSELAEADLDRAFAVNMKGVFFGCQAALRVMMPRRSGAIVNIASGVLDMAQGAAGSAPYSMSKAAVAMLSRVAATEAAPFGIRVNTISPGWVESAFTQGHLQTEDERTANRERARGMSPLGLTGIPEHIAQTFLYLVSDAAAYMTGQTLRPNGGATMPW